MNHKEYTIQQLRSTVLYGLDNDLIPSAEFAAERLIAETSGQDLNSIHLYGLVLLKKNRYKAAYNLTANKIHAGCAFVFAKAAFNLGKGQEGVVALLSTQSLWENIEDSLQVNYEFERKLLPDPAVFYSLLGRLYLLVGDTKESAINHSKALKRNPYLWESFEELNKMGANVRVKAIYKVSQSSQFLLGNDLVTSNGANDTSSFSRDPFGDTSNLNPPKSSLKSDMGNGYPSSYTNSFDLTKAIREESPEFTTPRVKQSTLPNAPSRKTRSSVSREMFKPPPALGSGGTGSNSGNGSESIKRTSRMAAATKVGSRLISQPLGSATKNSGNISSGSTSRKSSLAEASAMKRGKIFALGSSNEPGSALKRNHYLSNEEFGEQYVLNLYASYAKGYKAMCRYDCFKAIRILSALPKHHLNTPWVLSKLGRLHFEIVNYEESKNYFTKLRKLDNTRIEDMEYYSTLLWHLHEDLELCYLAHELQNIERNSPQTWVAIGNLFSLKREPDEAIKCFQRATQLDSNFAYAFTLQGHEYVSNDAYESALESFRSALLLDPRHYNALYGIGMVYLKLGDFSKAEFHFRKAVDINPVNVILICCVGMMLEKQGRRDFALKQYELACKIQPLSALALFKKAQLLFAMEQYHDSLVAFEHLTTLAPDEASVHFLLGQLYKMCDRKNDAIKQFTIALNLDPKGSHLVKDALEGLTNG